MSAVGTALPPGAGSTVAGNFLRLGAGELGARVIGFLVLIYLARTLGAELYGVVGFAFAVVLYLATVTDFGIETLGPHQVATRPRETARLASALLTSRVLLGGLLSAGVAGFALLFLSGPDASMLALYGLMLIPVGGSARWVHLGLEQAGPVVTSRVAGEGLRALLVVLLVRTPGDALYVPVAHALGEGLTALLLVRSLRARGIRVRPVLDPALAWPVFRSAWPVVVNLALGMVIYNSDVLLLRWLRTPAEVGFYLAAYTLITLLGNLSSAYGAVLLPTLTRVRAESAARGLALYRAALGHVVLAGLPLAVGGILLAPLLIPVFFGASYQPSVPVLQVLLLTTPLLLVRLVQHAALMSHGRQDRIMWSTAAAAVFNLAANLVVIPRYGITGAAATTLLSELLRTVLAQWFVLREGYPLAVLRGAWRPAAAAGAMAALLVLVPFASLWTGLLVGVLAYFGALTLFGGVGWQGGRYPVLRT